MQNIIIYTDNVTARLQYACKIMFEILQGMQVDLQPYPTSAPESQLPYLFYGTHPPTFPNVFFIEANGLLANQTINQVDVHYTTQRQLPVLFAAKGNLGYDVFTAIFYMVSRYEEYLPFTPDQFGRFPEKESNSGKYGFTNLPTVHYWVADFEQQFRQFFPGYQPRKPKASALFTYDIDVAYAYKGRSVLTHLGSLTKDVLKGRLNTIEHKLQSGFGKKEDPSDTYSFIAKGSLPKLFFFLWAAKRSKYDRNISIRSAALQQLVKKIANNFKVGIHPSYYSSEKMELILEEITALEHTLNTLVRGSSGSWGHEPVHERVEPGRGKSVTCSRQHFLRFKLPDTYRALLAAGILHDYSMQYAEMPGFRAGISVPYPYFDVAKNEETPLMIHPGCIMETTFRDDLNIIAAQSLPCYLELWEKIRAVGGQFIAIWHNDTLWDNLPDDHPLAFRQVHKQVEERIQKDLNS